MRLFFAIDTTEEIKESLREGVSAIGELGRHIKPVRVEGLHMTMLFLGEQPASVLPELGEIGKEAVCGARPCRLQIGPPSFFPRVSFLTLTGEITTLAVISTVLAERCMKYLEKPETRPFKAHLTLARHKQKIRAGEKGRISEIMREYEGKAWTADKLVLFESELTRKGAIYNEVGSFGFGG